MLGDAATRPYVLGEIPSGIDGVRATLKIMVKLVRTYRTDVDIRTLSTELTRGCPGRDATCEIAALQRFVRDRITYRRDVNGVETLQTPKELLRTKQGDCDDKATLLATMLQTIGFPTRFCAVGVREGPYSHVLVEAKAPGHPKADRNGWVALETILPGVEPGWFPPDATRKMVAHVS